MFRSDDFISCLKSYREELKRGSEYFGNSVSKKLQNVLKTAASDSRFSCGLECVRGDLTLDDITVKHCPEETFTSSLRT